MANDLQLYNTLVELAQKAERAYFVDNKPIMADGSFDELVKKIRLLEQDHPQWIRSDSPTQRIGETLSGSFPVYNHVEPMLSLENCFSLEDLTKQLRRMQAVSDHDMIWSVEPKVDGVSVDLCYINGQFVRAITRGNGICGDVITENVRTIKSVPLGLDPGTLFPVEWHVRGEIFLTFKVFMALNEEKQKTGQPLLANARNAAAGAVKLLSSAECASRKLSFVPYGVIAGQHGPEDHQATLRLLAALGFLPLAPVTWCRTVEEVLEAVSKFEAQKTKLPFPVDGAVIKVNKHSQRTNLGYGPIGPKWAAAFKYAAPTAESRILSVTIQVGKTGVLAPVAELEPVLLAGSVLSRATLHNASEITKKDIRVGDIVVVEKCGEIIPGVQSVRKECRTGKELVFVFPSVCPCCGTPAVRDKNADGELAAAWRCPNYVCPDQAKGRMLHWCSRGAMDIADIGPETIDKLYGMVGEIKTPADFYAPTFGALLAARLGLTMAKKILAEIEESRTRGLERVLIGLCIPTIGESLSKKLARVYPDMDTLYNGDWKKEAGLGEVADEKFSQWWKLPANVQLVRELKENGVSMKSKSYNPHPAGGPLTGQTFVITGTLDSMERPAAHAMIEALGGKATGSVSKKTTILVVGTDPGNNKIEAAQKNGTKVISEAQLLEMIKQVDL